MNETLYVVTTCFNPIKYDSRTRLYNEFRQRMLREPNVCLVTVYLETDGFSKKQVHTQKLFSRELKEITIRLGTDSILFFKENLLNIGFKHLPDTAKYVAWVDADVTFINPTWVQDTIDELKTHDVVQMFRKAADLDSSNCAMDTGIPCFPLWLAHEVKEKLVDDDMYVDSGAHYQHRSWYQQQYEKEKPFPAHGFAWAATIEFLKGTNGLGDTAILGSGDYSTNWALVGSVEKSFSLQYPVTEGYRQPWIEWEKLAAGASMSYVEGMVLHYWHGSRANRKYVPRQSILVDADFAPETHLERDANGLWRIRDDKPDFLEDMKAYFESRQEDETTFGDSAATEI